MSLLATLGLELDRTLLPASGLGWLVDYGKLPLAPAPLGPYEVLGGALEGGLPGGGEPLAGKGRQRMEVESWSELGSGGRGEEEFIHSCIYSFNKYFLSTYNMSGTVRCWGYSWEQDRRGAYPFGAHTLLGTDKRQMTMCGDKQETVAELKSDSED